MKKKPRARESSSSSSTARDEETEWEMRPGGMLVQKRTAKMDAVTRSLRLRIAYGALRYEICVSSMATFGKTISGSKL
ncbi:BAG family molecular chaperone regulator 2 [Spatholobus suberectus]|nr:BAG family molecular chaperone regulator 2 [Spatholobus suberectus]